MIQALKQFFDDQLNPTQDEPSPQHRLQVAAAALLFEISRSDRGTSIEERDKITALIKAQFELTDDEAQELFDEAAVSYRRALALRPRFPEAHFNLANVLRGDPFLCVGHDYVAARLRST